MPIINLEHGPQILSRYDVVGQQNEDQTHFVLHVGLFEKDNQPVKMGHEVSVLHMGPPLEKEGAIKVHVAGHVPLTNDERKKIGVWFEKIADEYQRVPVIRQYIIRPPLKDEYDSNTGVRRYRRYSCAGFVIDAHRQVSIELLVINEDTLPLVDRQMIISAYPDAEESPLRLFQYWGLEGNGPWKVVLAGYVLHALNRPTDQIRHEPYKAKIGDETF
jgi:hypothetical protein